MKTFLVLVLSVAALFVWQRQGSDVRPATKPQIATRSAPTTAPPPVSEHNWAKHSIDRAREVADQVRQSREQNGQP
jgi:hypothetical protein